MSEISNEKIQWLHDAATEFASTGMKMTMNPDEVLQLTTPLLALRERAEPVYQVQAMDWHDVEKYLYDEALDRGIRCRVLYTAPPAPVVTEWIACSERLPEVGDIVLTADNGCVNVGEMERSGASYGYFTSVVSGRELPATHWMPLPEAPGKEG
ncbi:DUF551 domain-containing protein [Cronobacter sakazakii]|uniref:DUF551 domain-containing protein n=1 Tax=Cronobacter sakazakii TaxID=28141 RepID=UPI00029BE6B6|nr:DUF551 domain-containing protein [Cronobacter sakazakii]AKE95956.1 hypothetical protein CSK29544_03005 [Cronobacter sakazakii]MDK1210344.1 DUF551 domain-containing protein [Cronobacter sakazakii]CCK12173.1 hypothetical protein BN126_2354 [Cronobacter sakazakii 680]SPW21893.1 Protein of uncharacterised function (DUF551) [Cronobacter sakazakii]